MKPSPDELAECKADYDAELEDLVEGLTPAEAFFAWISYPTFRERLIESGVEPPEPGTGLRMLRRMAEYAAFKADAFRHMPPSPERDAVERYFVTFDRWLHDREGYERFFPNG